MSRRCRFGREGGMGGRESGLRGKVEAVIVIVHCFSKVFIIEAIEETSQLNC